MKYVIDESICKKEGLELPSLLAVLLIKTGIDISKLFSNLEEKGVIVKDIFSNYLVTQRWDDICSSILLSSETSIPNNERVEELAIKLMSIMPQGKKEGTVYYYKGNKREIALKLKKFFKIYGKYTDEQIIEATQRYVNSFNGDYTYMKLLKYFIMKDERRVNAEGIGYIEEVSPLATFLENKDIINTDSGELV